ncbi:NUDIX hydrolase [Phycicoccus duodecadis]|uniref:NUDIX domain-containing protein n=1 Tax=Phycicoccus duodecadis TaxID=173053 RepID=A0A2N3YI62_9MICO|nr:CoA pyrophosphatase [Phycicoccus duodecadis]PKW26533.1 NUDIX domain-containing protein [Phycicoccus duodecadis]
MTSAPAWLTRLAARDDLRDHAWFAAHPPPRSGARESAVLVLFGPGEHGVDVVLTERAHTLRAHPGQVSFPGGGVDPGDDGHAGAALREAQEEVGLDPEGVDVLAVLPPLYLTPSRNAVTPVVGWWPEPAPIGVVDRREVARVVRAPVDDLLDPARRFTAVFGDYRAPGFEVSGLFVWGFTAMLLDSLLDLAGLTVPWDDTVERGLPDSVMSPWMRTLAEHGEGA